MEENGKIMREEIKKEIMMERDGKGGGRGTVIRKRVSCALCFGMPLKLIFQI